ncbi:MAG: hypothetical protein A2237_10820 [Stygiobacter sp. RIFOXYA2_FULL_38_8]|nr:MAG: hypothetical protein A2237_10820 [Stygiobacter sp. RIFOXYA2_FULL_38_8]
MNTNHFTVKEGKTQMKKIILGITLLTLLIFSSGSASAQSKLWATAYYAGWMQGQNNDGYLPAQNIDFSAITHIVHFALVPNADGTLDASANSITATNSSELITRAHAQGVKVLISIGGWNSGDGYRGAINSANLSKFVSNIVSFVTTRGYDGVDIDWEPLYSTDASLYISLINALRPALNAALPNALLTAANGSEADIYAQIYPLFDQINLMTYDMSGAWPGWVTWHNSPVSDGGYVFPSTGGAVPSANRNIDNFIAAGIPASKLGIGIDFYGYVWNGGNGTTTGGVTKPRQTWTSDPWVQGNVPYYTIMQDYYQPQYYNWDDAAKASYLSIDNSGSTNDKFISYDDEKTVQAKFDYARTKGIGGLIIWELGGGYRANQSAGQKDVLLQAVKNALNSGSTPIADVTPPSISITSPSNGASLLGAVTLSATASDNVGVAGVQFKVDGSNSGVELTTAPFSTSFNAALLLPGTHTISAVARDAAGNTSTASVNVSVIISTADTTPPVISITSPANNSTITGTVTINSNASDNIGVTGVQYKLDGSNLGTEVVTSPYNFSWNTAQTTDGTHTLSAVARDAAGNTSTALLTVNVSNTVTNPTSNLVVYDDVLQTLWTNSSWSASVNFSGTEKSYSGSSSIKTIFSSWGALSLQYGGWNSPGINPALYQQLKFAVYAPAAGTKLSVYFQNSKGQSFPSINYDVITANQWTVISIPMNQLNPNGHVFDRISIQESGGSNKTLFIDELSFIGNAVPTVPTAPLLASPINSSTGVPTNPLLSWSAADGAASYNLQVSSSSTFSSIAVDQKGITGTSSQVNGLTAGITYYWRVNATNTNGTGNWSSIFNFTTGSQTSSPGFIVYGDTLKLPWMNTSWGTTATFNSTQNVSQGSYSVSVVQSGWAGLRLRNGSWSNPVNINTSNYANFEFAAYGGINGLTLGVYFENDQSQSFPTVSNIQVAANQWQVVSVPISRLNPNNYAVNSITIQNFTNKQKTYFVDNINFNGTTLASKLSALTEDTTVPAGFNLDQNYPNPFNPSTIISFNISEQSFVTLKIYSILGQEVATLVSKTLPAGNYREVWDASNLPSGIYIYQLRSNDNVLVKKMNFIK